MTLTTHDMLTAREAAALLGVSVRAFYDLPIPRQQHGVRGTRWRQEDVETFREQCRVLRDADRRESWEISPLSSRYGVNLKHEVLLLPEKVRENKAPFPYSGPAVYFLFQGDEIVYIGKTANLLSRVSSHFGRKDFDHFSYLPCEREELHELERRAIVKYRPKLNRA